MFPGNRDMLRQVADAGRRPVNPLASHRIGHRRETNIVDPATNTQRRIWLSTMNDPTTLPTKRGRPRVPYLLPSVWTLFGSGALMHPLGRQERTMNLKASLLPGPLCLSGGQTPWEDLTCPPLRAMYPGVRDMTIPLGFRCSRWRPKRPRDRWSPHSMLQAGEVLTARVEPPALNAGKPSHRKIW